MTVDVSFMSSIDAARRDLRTDENEVMDLIADKQLLAFDLRTPNAQKSFVRIYTPSLDACVENRKLGTVNAHGLPPEGGPILDAIITRIIGTNKAHIRASLLKMRWTTSPDHIRHLIEARLLERVAGSGDAVNQTSMITRSSIVALLKARRMS